MEETTKGGVRLVVEGLDDFVRALREASAMVRQFGSTVESVSAKGQVVTPVLAASSQAIRNVGASAMATSKGVQVMTESMGDVGQYLTLTNRLAGLTADQIGLVEEAVKQLRAEGFEGTTIEAYNKAMARVVGSAQQTQEALAAIGRTADQTGRSFSSLGQATGQATAELKGLPEPVMSAETALSRLSLAMTILGAAVEGALGSMVLQAARIEELENLLEITRINALRYAESQGDWQRAAQLSHRAVQEQVEGIRKLHLSGIVANETVAKLIRYNLDWTRATELARAAQDSATYAMQDSSQALEGLINGIVTLQPRVLRTYGFFINLEQAYIRYAQANNLVAERLTVQQRQQAALNAVLDQTPMIMGAYEAVMETFSKQLRSLRTDFINLSEAYTRFLIPMLDQGITRFREMLQVLIDLPSPLRAAITSAVAASSTFLLLTGAVVQARRQIITLRDALLSLAAMRGVTLAGLLGPWAIPVGLVAGLAAVIAATSELQKQRQREAREILEASASYEEYIKKLDEAKLSKYRLSEETYKLTSALKEEKQAVFTAEMMKAIDVLEAHIRAQSGLSDVLKAQEWSLAANKIAMGELVETMPVFKDRVSEFIDIMREEIAVGNEVVRMLLADAEVVTRLAKAYMLSEEAIAEVVPTVMALARGFEMARREDEKLGDYALRRTAQQQEEIYTIEELRQKTYGLIEARREQGRQMREFADQTKEYLEAMRRTSAEVTQAYAWDIIEAGYRRNEEMLRADQEYADRSSQLWRDYARSVAEIEAEIAAFHAGTLQDLVELNQEYAQEQLEAWRELQASLEEAEAKFRENLAQAEEQHQEQLAEIDERYRDRKREAKRNLARDLEEIEADHFERLEELAAEHAERELELREEYGLRLLEIERQLQEERENLAERQEERISDLRLETLRRVWEEIEKQGQYAVNKYMAEWRRALAGLTPIEDFLKSLIGPELSAFYQQYMDELAKINEDYFWEMEDLKDDQRRAREEELAELEEWLARQQAQLDEAYAEQVAKEEAAYEQRKAERRRRYDEELAELEAQHQREVEAEQRAHAKRLAALQQAHEREKAEIERRYQERLAEMAAQYEREKQQILAKLQEQLVALEKQYKEQREKLNDWLAAERRDIARNYDQRIADAQEKAAEAILKARLEFEKAPAAFQSSYNALRDQAERELSLWVEIFRRKAQEAIAAMQSALQIHSPSRAFLRIGESVHEGLDIGLGDWEELFDRRARSVRAALANLGPDLSAEALRLNLNIARVAQAVPAAALASVPSQVSQNWNTNLTVTAYYARGQSEASLKDDLRLFQSMLRWRRV